MKGLYGSIGKWATAACNRLGMAVAALLAKIFAEREKPKYAKEEKQPTLYPRTFVEYCNSHTETYSEFLAMLNSNEEKEKWQKQTKKH